VSGREKKIGSGSASKKMRSNKGVNSLADNSTENQKQSGLRSLEMATVTKKKLIQTISQSKGLHPNDVRNVIQAFLDAMTDSLSQGDRLEFRDFGVFEVVERKQKIGRNPKNASVPIVIPARKAVKFTPGKKMRKLIE
jgi:integration host factor subunit beta